MLRALIVLAALSVCATDVQAQSARPASAWVAMGACDADADAATGVGQPEASLAPRCGGRRSDLARDSAREGGDRAPPTPAASVLLRARLSRVASERFGAMLTTLRLVWSGASDAARDWRLRGRDAVIASGLSEGEPRFALRAQFGLDANQASRSRTRRAGLRAPSERRFLYAEWDQRDDDRAETHALGMRWWVVPRRVAVELAAQWLPGDTDAAQPSLGLVLPVW
jgi:hypothetical protein